MQHPTIKNDFFNEKVEGPTKEISLKDAVHMALGYRIYFSKRLSPPGCICNGRVYTEHGDFVYGGDIDVFKCASRLEEVSDQFGVELFIFGEHGNSYYWRSSEGDMWQGGHSKNGEWSEEPVKFYEVEEEFQKHHDQRVRQWQIDHGLARRNPKEWFHDAWYRWKHTPSEIRFYARAKDISMPMKFLYLFNWIFRI
jgi:hypothetical protein